MIAMKTLIIPAFLVAFAGPALAYSDDELRTALVGAWGNKEDCSGALLVFKADGTFDRKTEDGTKAGGTYAIANGKLTGTLEGGNAMPEVSLEYDGKMLQFVESETQKSQLFPCPQ